VLITLFGRVLERVIKLVALGLVNKLFGMAFGLAKFLLILSALLFIWNGFPLTAKVIPDSWRKGSYLFEPISALAPAIYPVLKEQDWTDQLERHLEDLRDKVDI
jgi:membrane protein required for colicin V production